MSRLARSWIECPARRPQLMEGAPMSMVSLVPYYITELFSYGMAGGAGYLAWRVVRAYEARSVGPASVAALTERVASLEDAVGRVECRMDQTIEAQQFTTRVLMGRPR